MSLVDRSIDGANTSANIGNRFGDGINAPALCDPHVVAVRVMWQTGPAARAFHELGRRLSVSPGPEAVHAAGCVKAVLHMIVHQNAAGRD